MYLSIVHILHDTETLSVVEVPEFERPIPSSREDPPPTPVKAHRCDLVLSVTLRELDHLPSCIHIPHTHHGTMATTHNLKDVRNKINVVLPMHACILIVSTVINTQTMHFLKEFEAP